MFVKKYSTEEINERMQFYLQRQKLKENQHYCAKHVFSELYGEGIVVEGNHADPDEFGNIEWYNVEFDHGVEQVYTEDVEVMMAEYHNNHTPTKKKKTNRKVM